jgi:hypothetical protein
MDCQNWGGEPSFIITTPWGCMSSAIVPAGASEDCFFTASLVMRSQVFQRAASGPKEMCDPFPELTTIKHSNADLKLDTSLTHYSGDAATKMGGNVF